MKRLKTLITLLFAIVLGLLLIACEQEKNAPLTQHAEIISDYDECHLCGMQINHFIGPKGQVFGHGQAHSIKFCSTIDLFTWALQPENQARISAIYVHDMTHELWDKPQNNAFIDAKTAWYVWGHQYKGAMGDTLASFSSKEAAEQFRQQHGGQLYLYDKISLELLTKF
jgi:copper chaperone NosL